ncbi:MAG: hypothetical protein WD069_05000 [Planctomycetales bacterium]
MGFVRRIGRVGRNAARAAVRRWDGYWFRPGGELSLALCRIAIFSAMLSVHGKIAGRIDKIGEIASAVEQVPHPTGTFRLWPAVPPEPVVQVLLPLAYWATWAAIVGLGTRWAMLASTGANLYLFWYTASFEAAVSHGNNLFFLVGLAFMFGRAGDALSADRLLGLTRRRAGPETTGYWWPVLLAQFAVALMYFNACYWKLTTSGLRWAFSDNLRHQLAYTWWRNYGAPSPVVEWVVGHEWAWTALAAGSLLAQGGLLAACFLTRRPVWRAIVGGLFVAETVGLGVMVNLWHWEWLPFYALFVDWSALVKLRRVGCAHQLSECGFHRGLVGTARPTEVVARLFAPFFHKVETSSLGSGTPGRAAGRGRGAVSAYVLAYLGFYVLSAFTPDMAQKHGVWPFTPFWMYARNLASPPYSEHAPHDVATRRFEVVAPGKADHSPQPGTEVRAGISFHKPISSVAQVRRNLDRLWNKVRKRDRAGDAELLQFDQTVRFPAYPASAVPTVLEQGLTGVRKGDGTCLAAVATLHASENGPVLEIELCGFREPVVEWLCYPLPRDGAAAIEPRSLAHEVQHGRHRLEPLPAGAYRLLVRVRDAALAEDRTFLGPTWTSKKISDSTSRNAAP